MQLQHILTTAINAIMPIILLILVGYFLRRIGFLSEAFLKNGNKLTFRLLLPMTMFVNVYNIQSFASINWPVVLYCVAMLGVIFLLGMVTAAKATDIPQRKGVLLQATFRSNFAIIGLPLAAALGGEEATAIASVISAFTIPVFNILAVIALTIYVDDPGGNKKGFRSVLRGIYTNGLIIGTALGMLCLAIRSAQQAAFGEVVFSLKEDLPFVFSAMNQIKSITTPFALLVLGGQFIFSAVKGMAKEIAVGTLWRIVIAPVIGIGGAIVLSKLTNVLDFGVNEYPALIALFGSPTGVSSAIMAGQMGSDEQLGTQLVVWPSLLSIITIFVTVCVMMYTGLLPV